MVVVEDLLGQCQVDLVFRPDVPGKLRHPLQKGPDDLVLRGLGARTLQPLELALHLGLLLLAQLERLHPLPEVLHVVPLVLVTELALDLLELLPQQHLALPLTQLFLDPRLDLLLGVEASELALHGHKGGPHAFLVVQRLEESLFVLGGELEIERHQVREGARLIHPLDQLVERLRRYPPPGPELGGALPQLLVEGLEGRILRVGIGLPVHLQQDRPQHLLAIGLIGDSLRSALTLHKELDAAADSVGLDDPHHRPDGVEHLGDGVVHVLSLSHREKSPVSVEGILYGFDGTGASG